MSFEDGAKQHSFDLMVLEDAMKELYISTKCTKLAATILLMNFCTIHGVSNKFADELFALHTFIYYLNSIVWWATIMLQEL
jgi:hypothetical protein